MSEARVVLDGLNFPTSLVFDDDGRAYVAESGLPFGQARPGGRIHRIDRPDRNAGGTVVADGLAAPVTGLCRRDGRLYVSEGGAGRITRIDPDGARTTIVEGMPGPGNYHTNVGDFGPDGKLYFSQGAMSNLGIVGLDSYEIGWLKHLPHAHDIPGFDIELAGVEVTTSNPVHDGESATTGGFVPFGTRTPPGQRISASLPCTAAVMRCDADGSNLELVAWGLRNAFGLGFLPDGRLLAVDQGADDRGSRPIGRAPDLLFDVREGCWYGWPDFISGVPVTDPRFAPERGPHPSFLLSRHETLPEPQTALVAFEPHVAATKFAVTATEQLVVALFGDETPMTAPPGQPRVGRGLLLVDPADWSTRPLDGGLPLHRPIDVARAPTDDSLYVLDFGEFEMSDSGVRAQRGTGRLVRLGGWERT